MEELLKVITVKLTPRHAVVKRECLSKHYAAIYNILQRVVFILRRPGGRRFAASSQVTYAQEMFRIIKEVQKVNLYETQQGRALMRVLRVQGFVETVKAPVHNADGIYEMFKAVADDQQQYELMLIAFMTAARIGDLHYLTNRGPAEAGWRFTWTYHKTFHLYGAKDIVIPLQCIPPDLQQTWRNRKLGPVCTEAEKNELYATMEELFRGRTYCIRRSALQHFRYTLKLRPETIIGISMHSSVKTLDGYLASQTEFE